VTGEGTWSVCKIGPGGHVIWTRDVGTTGSAGGSYRHVATDGVNAYLIADIQDGNGNADFVAKIGPDGQLLWQVGTPGQPGTLDSVIVAADGAGMVYAERSATTAGSFGTMLPAGSGGAVVALDPSGKPKWGRLFDTLISDMVGLPGGGVVVAGGMAGGTDTATGCSTTPTGAFLAAYDPAGACLWLWALTGSAGTLAASASQIFAVDILDTSRVARGFGLDGTLQFALPVNVPYGNFQGLAAGPGGLAMPIWAQAPIEVSGQTFQGSPSVAAMLRIGAGGSFLWGRSSSCDACYSNTVAVDPLGNTLLAGFTATEVDFGAGPLMVGNTSYLVEFAP
jgi:hypothetical protein